MWKDRRSVWGFCFWVQEISTLRRKNPYELVQALDAPVLQMLEQLPNIVQFFAALSPVPEQGVEVPKILPHDVPMRRLCREPQLAEQVVEVPTILCFLLTLQFRMVVVELPEVFKAFSLNTVSAKRTANKIADIPAPRSGVRRLQGCLPEQSATAFGEADHRFPAASVKQIVDNPAPGGGLQDLRAGQSSASSSHSPADLADDTFQFFSHFSPNKKVRHYLRARGRDCLRTRAHERRLLMTSPCSRKRRRRRFDVEYVEFDGYW